MVIVHFIDGFFLGVCGFSCNDCSTEGFFSHIFGDFRIVGYHLRNYVAGSLQGFFCRINVFFRIDERLRRLFRCAVSLKLSKDNHSQRFQALFLGLGGTGGLFLLVWLVQVLDSLEHLSLHYFLAKFFRQLSLLVDEADYLFLSFLQISQVFKPFVQIAKGHIGKASGNLLTVSGDEGNGVTLVYELHGVLHLSSSDLKFACKFLNYIHSFILFFLLLY